MTYSLNISVTCIILIVLLGCAPQLGDSDAALALEDIAVGNASSRLKAHTALPSRRTVAYTVDGRFHIGDVYRSPQAVRASIVLVPGLVAAGKDDRRLVALANTLARLGFAVVVPDIQGLRRFHTRAHDVREVADAFRYLISQPELIPEGRAGLAGFSYGGGLVLLAALEPDIRAQVKFVMSFGGYYDMHSVVTYFTTGYYRQQAEGNWLYRQPHPYLKWVFTLSNADLLERPEDRTALRAYAQQLRQGYEPNAEIAPNQLAPDAQALYALVANEDPNRVPALIDKLSPSIRQELEGINLAAHDLSQLGAQVILLHGRGDTMIRYTESIALAEALPAQQVSLFLIEGYAHTDVRPKREDLPQLLAAMEMLLQQRITAPPIFSSANN